MLFLSHHCWKNVGKRTTEKQTINDCQIRVEIKIIRVEIKIIRILGTYNPLLQDFDGYMHLEPQNMYIQNTLTRSALGFLEHGLLLPHCSSTLLDSPRKILQILLLLSAISWFTHALTLHLSLHFFPASRKTFGSSFQTQYLDTLLKIQEWFLKETLPTAPQQNQKWFLSTIS